MKFVFVTSATKATCDRSLGKINFLNSDRLVHFYRDALLSFPGYQVILISAFEPMNFFAEPPGELQLPRSPKVSDMVFFKLAKSPDHISRVPSKDKLERPITSVAFKNRRKIKVFTLSEHGML